MSNVITGALTMTIGGAERPAYIGTRQTAIFCELQREGYDLQDYNTLLGQVFGNSYRLAQARKARATAAKLAAEAEQPFDADAYPMPEPIGRKELTPGELRDFVYSALAAGCKREKQPVTFGPDDVSDWIDEADTAEIMKPVRVHLALIGQRLERAESRPGNDPAPVQA